MSKKHRTKSHQSQTIPAQPVASSAPVRMPAMDTFVNHLARLGSASENVISAATYPLTRLTRNYQLLNSLYRNSWICNKIINCVADDMMKNGWDITAELTPDQTDRIKKLEQRTLVHEKLLDALYWGRLYGGAAAVMIIDGHEDKLSEPLDYDDILPDSFCGLMVVDRWSGIYPGMELITDHRDPDMGMPKYYEVKNNTTEALISKVHHSRVLRFTGKKLPYWEEMAEIYWGSSIMEHVFEELLKRDSTSWNIASLVFQANLLVDQVEGFEQMQSIGDPDMQRAFYGIKSAQNQMRSNNGMMIIGKDETLSALNYTFAGLDGILEAQMMDTAGAADIPVVKLFGRSPAGMNATGESDQQQYDDMIGQQQEKQLKPQINKLLPILFMSEFGEIPNDLAIRFNPVSTPTEDKAAETVGKKVDSISKTFQDGIISPKMYLQELHELSYNTNMFTSISDEDIEQADDKPQGATGEHELDLGMLGGNKGKGDNPDGIGNDSVPALIPEINAGIADEDEAIEYYRRFLERVDIDEPTRAIMRRILEQEEGHHAVLERLKTQRGSNDASPFVAMDTDQNSKWEESKHPRREDGKFGSGNGQSNGGTKKSPVPNFSRLNVAQDVSEGANEETLSQLDSIMAKQVRSRSQNPGAVAKAASGKIMQSLSGAIENHPGLDAAYSDIMREITRKDAPQGKSKQEMAETVSSILLSTWQRTSADTQPVPIAMQLAAQQEFGLDQAQTGHFAGGGKNKTTIKKANDLAQKHNSLLGHFLRAQYDETQAMFAENGIKEVTLFRGMQFGEDNPEIPDQGFVDFSLQPMSSFSYNPDTARVFAAQGNPVHSVMLAAKVPVSAILSTPVTGYGAVEEEEFVCLGVEGEAFAVKRKGNAGKFRDLDDFYNTAEKAGSGG